MKAQSIRHKPRLARMIAAMKWFVPGDTPVVAAQSEAQVVIQAPVDRVWDLLSLVEQWPRWNSAVQSARLQGSFTAGSTFVWRSAGFTVTSTLRHVEVRRRLAWTGQAFGTNAVHEWSLQETANGVVVRTSETLGGWLPRLMRGTMQKKLDSTLPRWLTSLKIAAESQT